MNRPKRLDFEQTFAGGFDYEEALENYCNILEIKLNSLEDNYNELLATNQLLENEIDKLQKILYKKEI